MQVEVDDLIEKVRIALDDILPDPETTTDSFAADVDTEIEQALLQAAEEVIMNAPAELLEPTVYVSAGSTDSDCHALDDEHDDGRGYFILPKEFLRLLEFQLVGWPGILTELVAPGTDEARMQRSKWSWGSPEKPKAMLSYKTITVTSTSTETETETRSTTTELRPCLLYWTAYKDGSSYKHLVKHLTYVEQPSVSGVPEKLDCAAKDTLEKNIIFTACRIFLTGKKETALADKFAELAAIY